MELILMRHAERDKLSGLPEHEQPLTAVGKENVRLVCRELRHKVLSNGINAIFSSPWRPAHDTAILASRELLFDGPVVKVNALAQDSFKQDDVLNLVRDAGASVILLVAHAPHIGNLVQELTGTWVNIKRGGAVGLELLDQGQGSRISWQLSPAEIRSNLGLEKKYYLEVAFYRSEPTKALSWDEVDVGSLVKAMAREAFHIGGQEGIIETRITRTHEWEFLVGLAIVGASTFALKVIEEFAKETCKWIKGNLKESNKSKPKILTADRSVSVEKNAKEIASIMQEAMKNRMRITIILEPSSRKDSNH